MKHNIIKRTTQESKTRPPKTLKIIVVNPDGTETLVP